MKKKSILFLLSGLLGSALMAGTETNVVDSKTVKFAPLSTADRELAEPAWNRHCAKCHGKDGNGPASKMGERLGLTINYMEPGALDTFTDEQLTEITTNGIEGSKMNGYSKKLSLEEISALTRYMRSMSKP